LIGREADLRRIGDALVRARAIFAEYTAGEVSHRRKAGGDPVTEADLRVNQALHECLPAAGDGWLSEETADDAARLACRRVWVVDPLDGTREFVDGLPEWCVSIALVEDGRAVAGGICNPMTDETVLGSRETGVMLNGRPVRTREIASLAKAEILASRSEVRRGEWRPDAAAPFRVRPLGSVAYKLSLVAAGLADATWTLVPKHEWDVAAGAALVLAAGGAVWIPGGDEPSFNRSEPRLTGLVAAPPALVEPIRSYLAARPAVPRSR